jgi:hypothetical protein
MPALFVKYGEGNRAQLAVARPQTSSLSRFDSTMKGGSYRLPAPIGPVNENTRFGWMNSDGCAASVWHAFDPCQSSQSTCFKESQIDRLFPRPGVHATLQRQYFMEAKSMLAAPSRHITMQQQHPRHRRVAWPPPSGNMAGKPNGTGTIG